MGQAQDFVWFGESDTRDVRELYELAKVLLTLSELFETAYGRAVFSLLADGAKGRFEHSVLVGDARDALDRLLEERDSGVIEAILGEALATTAERLPRLQGCRSGPGIFYGDCSRWRNDQE